jgi:hypothetical protein
VTFSDDDVKRLKEKTSGNEIIQSLIERLGKAEAVCQFHDEEAKRKDANPNRRDLPLLKKWREVCGK